MVWQFQHIFTSNPRMGFEEYISEIPQFNLLEPPKVAISADTTSQLPLLIWELQAAPATSPMNSKRIRVCLVLIVPRFRWLKKEASVIGQMDGLEKPIARTSSCRNNCFSLLNPPPQQKKEKNTQNKIQGFEGDTPFEAYVLGSALSTVCHPRVTARFVQDREAKGGSQDKAWLLRPPCEAWGRLRSRVLHFASYSKLKQTIKCTFYNLMGQGFMMVRRIVLSYPGFARLGVDLGVDFCTKPVTQIEANNRMYML